MEANFPDQPTLRYTLKDKEALKQAEDYVINMYTSYTRNVTEQWGLTEEELTSLRYNDSPGKEDGYLIAGIGEAKILSYQGPPDEAWEIEVTPDIGIAIETEILSVYQGQAGEWIVETA